MFLFKFWKKLKYSLLFLLVLATVFIISNLILPYPLIPNNIREVSQKLKYFTKHKDEYNAIFIGPSSVYNGVIPNLFDRIVTNNSGVKIKSFNFAISGAVNAEIDFLIRKIISLKPANLKFFFVEYYSWGSWIEQYMYKENFKPTNLLNPSTNYLYWHTLRGSIIHARTISESKMSVNKKIKAHYTNIRAFYSRFFKVSLVSNIWQRKRKNLARNNSVLNDESLTRYNGYSSVDWSKFREMKKIRQYFLANLDSYEQKVQKLKDKDYELYDSQPSGVNVVQDIEQYLLKHNIQPIFIVTPVVEPDYSTSLSMINAYEQGKISVLLPFNDPIEYPNLYAVDLRFDRLHLNHQGAITYTQLLAQEFSNYLIQK